MFIWWIGPRLRTLEKLIPGNTNNALPEYLVGKDIPDIVECESSEFFVFFADIQSSRRCYEHFIIKIASFIPELLISDIVYFQPIRCKRKFLLLIAIQIIGIIYILMYRISFLRPDDPEISGQIRAICCQSHNGVSPQGCL